MSRAIRPGNKKNIYRVAFASGLFLYLYSCQCLSATRCGCWYAETSSLFKKRILFRVENGFALQRTNVEMTARNAVRFAHLCPSAASAVSIVKNRKNTALWIRFFFSLSLFSKEKKKERKEQASYLIDISERHDQKKPTFYWFTQWKRRRRPRPCRPCLVANLFYSEKEKWFFRLSSPRRSVRSSNFRCWWIHFRDKIAGYW